MAKAVVGIDYEINEGEVRTSLANTMRYAAQLQGKAVRDYAKYGEEAGREYEKGFAKGKSTQKGKTPQTPPAQEPEAVTARKVAALVAEQQRIMADVRTKYHGRTKSEEERLTKELSNELKRRQDANMQYLSALGKAQDQQSRDYIRKQMAANAEVSRMQRQVLMEKGGAIHQGAGTQNGILGIGREIMGNMPGVGMLAGGGPVMAGMAGIGLIGTGLAKATKQAADFEDTVADMSALTGITGAKLQGLANIAREMGKKFGIDGADGVTAMKLTISSLGPEIAQDEKAMRMLTEAELTLAKASGLDLQSATLAVVGTMNQFGLEAKDAGRIINVMAAAAKEGNAEIPDLTSSFQNAGTVAALMKVSVEESAAAIEVLAKAEIKGGEAGTGFRNILLKMSSGSKEASDDLAGMGLSFADINPKVVGLQKGLETLAAGYLKLKDPTAQAEFLMHMFGAENAASATQLLTNTKLLKDYTTKITGTNSAQEQANVKMNTANERWKRLHTILSETSLVIGEKLLPTMSRLGESLEKHGPAIERMVTSLGKIIDQALTLADLTSEGKVGASWWSTLLGPVGGFVDIGNAGSAVGNRTAQNNILRPGVADRLRGETPALQGVGSLPFFGGAGPTARTFTPGVTLPDVSIEAPTPTGTPKPKGGGGRGRGSGSRRESVLSEMLAILKEEGFVATSTTGGTHNAGSAHYSGRAVDARSRGKSEEEIQELVKAMSDAGFIFRDERERPAGQKVWGGPHLHFEAPKGRRGGRKGTGRESEAAMTARYAAGVFTPEEQAEMERWKIEQFEKLGQLDEKNFADMASAEGDFFQQSQSRQDDALNRRRDRFARSYVEEEEDRRKAYEAKREALMNDNVAFQASISGLQKIMGSGLSALDDAWEASFENKKTVAYIAMTGVKEVTFQTIQSLIGEYLREGAAAMVLGTTKATAEGIATAAVAGAAPVVVGAKAIEATAYHEAAHAAILSAGAKTLEAESGIPFLGIALGLAGLAAIAGAYMSFKTKKLAQGAILDRPTFAPYKGGMLEAGEAGPEVVAPLGGLMGMIKQAVKEEGANAYPTQNPGGGAFFGFKGSGGEVWPPLGSRFMGSGDYPRSYPTQNPGGNTNLSFKGSVGEVWPGLGSSFIGGKDFGRSYPTQNPGGNTNLSFRGGVGETWAGLGSRSYPTQNPGGITSLGFKGGGGEDLNPPFNAFLGGGDYSRSVPIQNPGGGGFLNGFRSVATGNVGNLNGWSFKGGGGEAWPPLGSRFIKPSTTIGTDLKDQTNVRWDGAIKGVDRHDYDRYERSSGSGGGGYRDDRLLERLDMLVKKQDVLEKTFREKTLEPVIFDQRQNLLSIAQTKHEQQRGKIK